MDLADTVVEDEETMQESEPMDRFATVAEDGCTTSTNAPDSKRCATMPPGQRLDYKVRF